MVMLRVTAGTPEDGEKEAYLRSLPRPESGRGPATVSSHSWSRRPMRTPVVHLRALRVRSPTCVCVCLAHTDPDLALFSLVLVRCSSFSVAFFLWLCFPFFLEEGRGPFYRGALGVARESGPIHIKDLFVELKPCGSCLDQITNQPFIFF
jgi:hypothetical protein